MTECSITVWPVPREPPSPDQQCRPHGGRPGHSWAASSAHTESHSDYQGRLPYVQEGKETIIPCSTGKRVTKTYFHWGRWCRMESSQLEQKLWSIRWRTWISWGNQVSEVCMLYRASLCRSPYIGKTHYPTFERGPKATQERSRAFHLLLLGRHSPSSVPFRWEYGRRKEDESSF